MKIITPGIPRTTQPHKTTCTSCGCVFEFTEPEAKKQSCPREGMWWEIKCPQEGCKNIVTYTPRHG